MFFHRPLGLVVAFVTMINLSACGFALRGTSPAEQISLQAIDLSCPSKQRFFFCHEIEQLLAQQGIDVDQDASVLVQLTPHAQTQKVLTLQRDASASEYQIRRGVQLTVVDKTQDARLLSTDLYRQQIYRNSDITKISKDREQQTVQDSLDSELANDVTRALSNLSFQSNKP